MVTDAGRQSRKDQRCSNPSEQDAVASVLGTRRLLSMICAELRACGCPANGSDKKGSTGSREMVRRCRHGIPETKGSSMFSSDSAFARF